MTNEIESADDALGGLNHQDGYCKSYRQPGRNTAPSRRHTLPDPVAVTVELEASRGVAIDSLHES